MAVTVSDVLNLEVFHDVEIQVLTGEEHLAREIRWVHASELPDIAQFLSGGELLLTAGIGIGDTELLQRAYVASIAKAGAAALVIEGSGRMFTEIPEAIIDESASWNLPVVSLGKEVPFAAVSAQVHEVLAQERVDVLAQERQIEASFSDLLLQGADYLSIMRELGRTTGTPVVLENYVRQVIAYVGKSAEADEIVDDWSSHSRQRHTADSTCCSKTVMMRGQPWGWIHLPLGPSRPGGLDEFAVERASAAVAISLLTDRTHAARKDQRSTSLITRLILGDLTGSEFAQRSRGLGYNLGNDGVVVIVLNDEPASQDNRATQPFISADLGDYSLLVIPATQLNHRKTTEILTSSPQGGGISRRVSVESLPAAITQAKSAAAVSLSLPDHPVKRFDELGVERLLVTLAEGTELSTFVEDELGPIMLADAKSANQLLPTLRTYLDCDGHKSAAAQRLSIQRRTLYNRLERISKLLGSCLDEPATRQRLFLAVKGLDLIGGEFAVRP